MADAIQEISMPKLGETVTEGTLGRWLKAVGDTVAFHHPLFEVSTDKVDSEIPSPYDGVLLEILVQSGETVHVGILCTDGVKKRPVAVGDAIAIHPTGVVGLVYDHRAFDGSTASMFLLHIRDSLEKRDWEAE